MYRRSGTVVCAAIAMLVVAVGGWTPSSAWGSTFPSSASGSTSPRVTLTNFYSRECRGEVTQGNFVNNPDYKWRLGTEGVKGTWSQKPTSPVRHVGETVHSSWYAYSPTGFFGCETWLTFQMSTNNFQTIEGGLYVDITTPYSEPNERSCTAVGPITCKVDESASRLSGDVQDVKFTFYFDAPKAG
jgi:hypothetical protein